MERKDHIFLIGVRQSEECAYSRDALLGHDLLVGGIAVHYGNVGERLAYLVTLVVVLLNDLNVHLALFEYRAQVVRDLARADDHSALDACGFGSYLLKEVLRSLGGGYDGHYVARTKDKIALGNERLVTSLNSGKENVALILYHDLLDRHTYDGAVLGETVSEQLDLALTEGFNAYCGGAAQDSGYLLCGYVLGVDDHGESELVL